MNMDDQGAHQRALTPPDLNYSQVSWRPDGKLMVYAAYSYLTGENDIYQMAGAGQNRINMTSIPSEMPTSEYSPSPFTAFTAK